MVWTAKQFDVAAKMLEKNRVMLEYINPDCETPCHEWGVSVRFVKVNGQCLDVTTLACEVKTRTKKARNTIAHPICRNTHCIRPEHIVWITEAERRALRYRRVRMDTHLINKLLYQYCKDERYVAHLFRTSVGAVRKIDRDHYAFVRQFTDKTKYENRNVPRT